MIKSLKARHHSLASPLVQLTVLQGNGNSIPRFETKLQEAGLDPLQPTSIDTLQINLGRMCNQTCSHCHVDAGPDRQEIMTRETMGDCLAALGASEIGTVDLTGGAPEMNPHFTWFVSQVRALERKIIVRSNLTILTSAARYRQLPSFFAENQITVVSSLPCYTQENTDKQRGDGVFSRSIEALQMLNAVGYGVDGSGLELNLVYNPLGAFIPPSQEKLEQDYKRILKEQHGIVFNHLFCIANMPISRFLEWLIRTERYEDYMQLLVDTFNASAARNVMCRNLVSVGWDGSLFDCDFNQMLDLPLNDPAPKNIRDFNQLRLQNRRIKLNRHCFGCTAGSGSSCGGEIA